MRRLALSTALLSVLVCGSRATAELLTIDPVPAATLLLPYFQVDCADPNGPNMVFSVNNVGAAPAIARVTLWTDFGLPSLAFDLLLTGFDAQTIRLRDIFFGELPSAAGIPPPECLPAEPLSAAQLQQFQAAHTSSPPATAEGPSTGGVAGVIKPPVAVGYITVDAMNECIPDLEVFPGTEGYFENGGTGLASNDNVLWGDYFLIERNGAVAAGEIMVPIEAEAPLVAQGAGFVPSPTFYDGLVGTSGADNREPLKTQWAVRYELNDAFDATELIVWRNADAAESQVVVFDELEESFVLAPMFDPFPSVTNRVAVDGPTLPTPFDAGWIFLDFGAVNKGAYIAGSAQAYVTAIRTNSGRYQVGLRAIEWSDPFAVLE